jgi:virulence-associated protein VapD
MNEKQRQALDDLQSTVENLEFEDTNGEGVVFVGDSADGPVAGFVEVDGSVTYL